MPAVKTNNETSQFIKEDLTFTSRDLKENPEILRPFFEKRKHQRFAFLIHGYCTGHLRYDIHLKRKCFVLSRQEMLYSSQYAFCFFSLHGGDRSR